MHDPMTVALTIVRPMPQRSRHHDAQPGQPRWSARYQWATWRRPWRGWCRFWTVAGVGLYWPALITIWHVEPGGRDSGEVCRHHVRSTQRPSKRRLRWSPFLREHPPQPDIGSSGGWISDSSWRWHIHHWRIQVHPWQQFRARFERCAECGRRMNKATRIGVGWDAPGVTHKECNELRWRRSMQDDTDQLVYRLFAAYRTAADLSPNEALDALQGQHGPGWTERWRQIRRLREQIEGACEAAVQSPDRGA